MLGSRTIKLLLGKDQCQNEVEIETKYKTSLVKFNLRSPLTNYNLAKEALLRMEQV